MIDFSFLMCHNKCVSMLIRFNKAKCVAKDFAGCGVYIGDDKFRRAYCHTYS